MKEINISRLFWPAVVVTLAAKLILSGVIPITSDEAYFTVWGASPSLGYYDHPPMVGWLLYLISYIGHSVILIRLPAVLSTTLIAVGVYYLLKPYEENKAALASVFLLVSPLNILNVLITTDTPFIFFSFLSVFLLHFALKKQSLPIYAASGMALGAAFLSKYFAVFLGISYLLYFILTPKHKDKTRGFLLLFVSVLPFAALNIYWNYSNCWSNIMFNMFNRNKKEAFSFAKILLFVVCQLYLLTPAVVYYLYKRAYHFSENYNDLKFALREKGFILFAFAMLIPIILFGLLSAKKVVGLHWLLGFYPFMYILVFFLLTEEELMKTVKITAVFTIVHLFLIGAVLSVPVQYFQKNKNYSTIIMGTRPAELNKYLSKYEGGYVLMTPSYADSALLTWHFRRYFPVFGGGSHHGRQDDILTDFSEFAGKNILIIRSSEPKVNEYSTFFKKIEIERIVAAGAQFYLIAGYDFSFKNYRDVVLRDIKEKYYNIPPWLPTKPGTSILKYFS